MFLFFSLSPGHKDSVTCAGFSHDSTFVATGDMSGLIKVWRVDAKEEIWSFEAGDLEVRNGAYKFQGKSFTMRFPSGKHVHCLDSREKTER